MFRLSLFSFYNIFYDLRIISRNVDLSPLRDMNSTILTIFGSVYLFIFFAIKINNAVKLGKNTCNSNI